ncbi:hypothetical protein CHH57_02190 [Niallia circulans]|uniref:Uncharacterized protein n=1 Tax=Niallia circulans TaxID=1397 RepID=A0AA91Z2A7_NIACI|nr:hypothetical protein [Niallia circulans]PAD84862.1 hypothetical protein CHH57_02190 [Niallia circulans]
MNQMILEYAITGVENKISELEKTISKGERYLSDIKLGNKVRTEKTADEISHVIIKTKGKIEELTNFHFDLVWKLSVGVDE